MKTYIMKKRINRNRFLSIALFAGIIGMLYLSTGAVVPIQKQAESDETNKKAPEISLSDISGEKISLEKLRGKVILLDFWATWCPPCRMSVPDLLELQNRYSAKKLQVIGIGLDKKDNIILFAEQYKINYPVAAGDQSIANKYGGITGIPTMFIIDKKGNIRKKFEGYTRKNVLEAEIEKLLK